MNRPTLFVLAFTCAVFSGCVGPRGAFSSSDPAYFSEQPYVAVSGDQYALRWRYGTMGFYFRPEHEVKNGELLFWLSATTSSGKRTNGELSITDLSSIQAIEAGEVFWLERGRKVLLEVRHECVDSVQLSAATPECVAHAISKMCWIGYDGLNKRGELDECQRLFDSLEKLQRRLDTVASFSSRTFILKPGQYRKVSKRQEEGDTFVFITGPVKELNGRCLIFISAIAPARFAILEVAEKFSCRLLYDGWGEEPAPGLDHERIDPICSLEWLPNGSFFMKERTIQSGSRMAGTPRAFLLNFENNQPKFCEVESGN